MNTPGVTITGFLDAFFPNPLETVNLRAFTPRGVKTCGDGEKCDGHKLPATRRALLDDQDLRDRLAAVNKEHGLYFVVNAGGDKDADIERYNAFFAEIDDKPVEEQNAILDACPIPPSIRVETRKSVHAYWPIEGLCDEKQWREVQARLISHFASDPKIKNPSRVMRLPGFDHVDKDGARKRVRCTVFDPSLRYTAAEMLAAFRPAPKETEPKPKKPKAGATGTVKPGRIKLEVWDGCDSYMGCSQCGDGKPDEGPRVILRRHRTQPFAVADDGKLMPVCIECAERIAPETYAEWERIAGREFDEEQAARRRSPFFNTPPEAFGDIEIPF